MHFGKPELEHSSKILSKSSFTKFSSFSSSNISSEGSVTVLKKEVGGLVINASEKVIKKNMDTETNKKLISEFLEDSGVA